MPKTIRERIGAFMLGEDVIKALDIQRLVSELEEAEHFEAVWSPQAVLNKVAELDPHMVDMLRSLTNYEVIGSYGTDKFSIDSARTAAVVEANLMYDQDVITQYMVNLWTDFGFGLSLEVVPRDENAQAVWDEFWTADRNSPVLSEREIHNLSTDLLNDGEVFLNVTASTFDGQCTVRAVPSREIKKIIYDPEDGTTPVFYKREYSPDGKDQPGTIYYPDWRVDDVDIQRVAATLNLHSGEVIATDVRPSTVTGMIAAMHRKRYGRGWPLLKTSFPWNRVYKSFLQDRAAVERAAAAYLDVIKAKTGSRGIDAIKQSLQSSLAATDTTTERNPPPVAGATWLENEAITRSRLSQGTGAADADTDGQMLLAQVGLGGSIYPHYLGRGDAFRLATASAMEGPLYRAFNRYRNFWSSVWSDLARFVLVMAQTYNKQTTITDLDVDVAQDAVLSQSVETIGAVATVVQKSYELGIIDPEVAELATEQILKTSLAMLGVRNVDGIVSPPISDEEPAMPIEPFVPELTPEELAELEEWQATTNPFQ